MRWTVGTGKPVCCESCVRVSSGVCGWKNCNKCRLLETAVTASGSFSSSTSGHSVRGFGSRLAGRTARVTINSPMRETVSQSCPVTVPAASVSTGPESEIAASGWPAASRKAVAMTWRDPPSTVPSKENPMLRSEAIRSRSKPASPVHVARNVSSVVASIRDNSARPGAVSASATRLPTGASARDAAGEGTRASVTAVLPSRSQRSVLRPVRAFSSTTSGITRSINSLL